MAKDTPSTPRHDLDGALPAIVTGSDSIQGVLERMVEHLSTRWATSACAILLYDEAASRLTLRAGYGIPGEWVGKWSLPLDEGLPGRTLRERQPYYTERASEESERLSLPDTVAKNHETLLLVPILHGEERVGVLSLQRPTGTPFSKEEISGLRTAAAQMAGAIENARALILAGAKPREADMEPLTVREQRIFRGSPVSSGVAIGRSRILMRTQASVTIERCKASNGRDCHELDEAIERTVQQLTHYQESLGQRLPEAAALLFETQLLMLKDDSFIGKIRAQLDEGVSAPRAVANTARNFIDFFEASRHDYLREKARDVEDVALRLLENLVADESSEPEMEAAQVIVTASLLPSDILRVAQNNVQGIVLVGGGSTAHITLLVKSLRIPTVMTEADELLRLRNDVPMIIDCASGNIIVCPTPTILGTYEERRRLDRDIRSRASHVKPQTTTRDGVRVRLMANINLLAELEMAIETKAEGVGLYRTEFPFLMRQTLPTEEEQLAVYERLLDAFPDRPITFRTLDAGGDKVLSYFDQAREENPALGLRSTRFTLRYPYIFNQQLRAILRAIQARQRHDVRVMFPMIGSIEEFLSATERLDACIDEIRERYPERPPIRPDVGTMVELPALVHLARGIAREAAFLSIGTNDFIQYMLAADRTNAEVSSYYIPHHPAVLHALRHVVHAANSEGKEISVCGEMGRDPRYVPFFIGIGVRVFSLDPAHIGTVQDWIQRISIPEAEQYAQTLLETDRINRIEETLARMMVRFNLPGA